MHATNVLPVHLHVLNCTPLFRISTFTGRIMLKYVVLLDPLATRFVQAMSTHVHKCN